MDMMVVGSCNMHDLRQGSVNASCRDDFMKKALGTTSFNGTNYNTTAQSLTGVLPVGTDGVNHGKPVNCSRFFSFMAFMISCRDCSRR